MGFAEQQLAAGLLSVVFILPSALNVLLLVWSWNRASATALGDSKRLQVTHAEPRGPGHAMIPGVFALSAWDLVGALPVPAESVPNNLTAGGDWRWVNRGAVDLVNANPTADKSSVLGLPKAKTLYGPVPDQLKSPDSFASRIKQMLAARKQFRLAEATMNAVPNVGNPAVCVLVMTLPDNGGLAVTALNYGRDTATFEVDLAQVPSGIPAASLAGQQAQDIVIGQATGNVSDAGRLPMQVEGLAGKTIVVPQRAQ